MLQSSIIAPPYARARRPSSTPGRANAPRPRGHHSPTPSPAPDSPMAHGQGHPASAHSNITRSHRRTLHAPPSYTTLAGDRYTHTCEVHPPARRRIRCCGRADGAECTRTTHPTPSSAPPLRGSRVAPPHRLERARPPARHTIPSSHRGQGACMQRGVWSPPRAPTHPQSRTLPPQHPAPPSSRRGGAARRGPSSQRADEDELSCSTNLGFVHPLRKSSTRTFGGAQQAPRAESILAAAVCSVSATQQSCSRSEGASLDGALATAPSPSPSSPQRSSSSSW